MVRVCTVWMMVLLLPAVASAVVAEPNVEAVWPEERDRPVLEQAREMADTLGLERDYTLLGRGARVVDQEWDEQTETLRIDLEILKETVHLRLPAARTVEVIEADCTEDVVDLVAEAECSDDIKTTYRLEPRNLPTGLRLAESGLTVEAAPDRLRIHGSHLNGARAIASALGLPVDQLPWEEAKEVRLSSPLVPGIAGILCDCTEWAIEGPIQNANRLRWTVTADGELIRFVSAPWLDGDIEPTIDAEQAKAVVRDRLGAAGVVDPKISAHLYWDPDHGLYWHLPFLAMWDNGAVGLMWIGAHDGEILYEEWDPIVKGGDVATAWAPSVWQVSLVVLLAWSTTRRFA